MNINEFLSRWHQIDGDTQVFDFRIEPGEKYPLGSLDEDTRQCWLITCSVGWAEGYPLSTLSADGHTSPEQNHDTTVSKILDDLDTKVAEAMDRARRLGDRLVAGVNATRKPILTVVLGAGFSAGLHLPLTTELAAVLREPCTDYRENDWVRWPGTYDEALRDSILRALGNGKGEISDIEAFLSMWEGERDQWDYTGLVHGAPLHYKRFLENMAGWFAFLGREADGNPSNAERLAGMANWLQRARQQYDVRFVTFNYDLIVERICRRARVPFAYLGAREGELPIRKLHGSVNFSHAGYDLVYDVDDVITVCADLDQPPADWGGELPVIMPPVAGKRYNGFFEWVWKFALEDIGRAEKVLFVGYSFPLLDVVARQRLRDVLETRGEAIPYVLPEVDRHRVVEAIEPVTCDWRGGKWQVEHFDEMLQ